GAFPARSCRCRGHHRTSPVLLCMVSCGPPSLLYLAPISLDRFRPSVLKADGLTLDITEIEKSFAKNLEGRRGRRRGRKWREDADLSSRGLLRARRERPRYTRAAEQRYERAALHSITSSARASKVAGTSRPSALAVFRLITSSNLVGCMIGRSAGFAPLRMRPAYTPVKR